MKKWLIALIVVVVLGFITYNSLVGFNNKAVVMNENVEESWEMFTLTNVETI